LDVGRHGPFANQQGVQNAIKHKCSEVCDDMKINFVAGKKCLTAVVK